MLFFAKAPLRRVNAGVSRRDYVDARAIGRIERGICAPDAQTTSRLGRSPKSGGESRRSPVEPNAPRMCAARTPGVSRR
jgi:hypothetical protein